MSNITANSISSLAPRQLQKFAEEIQLMAACRHNNCVQFFGACLEAVRKCRFFITAGCKLCYVVVKNRSSLC